MTSDAGTGARNASERAVKPPTYEESVRLLAEVFGGDLHQGYWESPADRSTLAEASLRFTDLIADRLKAGPGDTVLDIGCGIGGPAIRLARSTGAAVVGVTNSPVQVEKATKRARDAGIDDLVTFRCADAMDLPFEPGSFDAVCLIEAVFAMPDRLTVLRQAARVLGPAGRLVFTDILDRSTEPGALGRAMAALDEHRAGYGLPRTVLMPIRLADEEPLLARAGLRPVEMTDIAAHTVDRTPEFIRERLAADRDRLVRLFGTRLVELYETTLPLIEAIGWGHGLIVAAPAAA